MATLRFPDGSSLEPLPAATLHLVVDMQRLFADRATAWSTPALHDILPAVTRLCRAQPERTVFARFVTPHTAADAPGRWRRYYERWAAVTTERLDPALLALVPALQSFAAPGRVFDKTTYSAFGAPAFVAMLEDRAISTIVLTGVETDVCVLATLLEAVDRGYRVVVPADAVASGSLDAHAATIAHLLPRLSDQVDVTTTEALLAAWR